jgi:hypothetical protein
MFKCPTGLNCANERKEQKKKKEARVILCFINFWF